ncbi:NAD(P)-dependent dehydrogenase, short-chain alcohol dehydrogenase family [Rhizobium sp. NFR07]|uniref:SDR family NAD(P)-dependent oxidoreductase n=1 Tax=Rhizobium sp. NFR07 TaxID=1566262 RepID=UPI0008F165D9|nr:SDR family oxidoreductase [Rhizobium sp. NFR07]SFB16164.1 NAD(P)-dependent dehydrogenase, short-chain alcohol dehydrogenase family [Rhizobium sp. NFR07]
MSKNQPLKGRVAIVTGAGGDIGYATAKAFAEAGASVALLDLHAVENADAMFPIACDIADPAAVEAAVDKVVAKFGRIDMIVNNAAAETPLGTVCDIPLESWKRTLDVNLTGAFLLCKYAIPHMRRQGGVILNIASQLGHVTTPGRAAYSASKAALHSLTRSLALDHAADGIRAVSLSPGAVLTSRVTRQAGGEEQAVAALAPLHPIGRIGTPQEIAATALFLVSDGAAFITGTDVLVDGGYTAR